MSEDAACFSLGCSSDTVPSTLDGFLSYPELGVMAVVCLLEEQGPSTISLETG
jgi:hypothetical protein